MGKLTRDSHYAYLIVELFYVIGKVVITILLSIHFASNYQDEVFECNDSLNCNGLHTAILAMLSFRIIAIILIIMAHAYVISGGDVHMRDEN